ncbi:hypothetical protein K2O51_31660 (plasmid) [Cupriavidus pinatubonensis]|uniref:hypothetical protein n=1 Tax=Cupriavidus pinatubonensis TaxID=248026 RepID=UPI001C739EE4|nr:hypothetical protein [Cupriavidus pinatubonensis]QYY33585.1 hypothetical protein K2O51_31660 [Cupriavidus pinatubonensis]
MQAATKDPLIASTSYRVSPALDRRPAGRDGQGWNRLAIIPMEPLDRCLLRPKYRQAALDTLRGMGHFGVATAYDACTSAGPCNGCNLAQHPREPWQDSWEVEEKVQGPLFIHHIGTQGSPVHSLASWSAFMRDIDAPTLRRHIDGGRTTWRAA